MWSDAEQLKQFFHVVGEEVIVFENAQNGQIQNDVGGTYVPLELASAFQPFQQDAASVATESGEGYEQQKTPVPPSVKDVAANDDEQILHTQWFEQKPVT